MTDSYNIPQDIFEKETKKFIRLLFYEKKKRKFRAAAAVLLVPLLILGNSYLVKADFAYFYSPLCLGSWLFVNNVEGEPQMTPDDVAENFDNSNSAVLKNSSGQIFCGKFESPNQTQDETGDIFLKLSLAVRENAPVWLVPQDLSNENVLDSETNQDGIFIIETPAPASEERKEQTAPPENEEPAEEENAPTGTEATPEPTESGNGTPAPETTPAEPAETPAATPIETPSEIPAETPAPTLPPPEETPQPAPQEIPVESPTSILHRLFNINHAQAEENPVLNFDDLLSVRYTMDGETWFELGKITKTNWRNARFKIPLNSAEEIARIQIGLVSLPTFDGSAVIYLDSMWLEVETKSKIVEFVQEIGETIVETLTLRNLAEIGAEIPSPTPVPEPKKVKIMEYKLRLDGQAAASDELDWYPREDSEKLLEFAQRKSSRGIEVELKENFKKLLVTGSCNDDYFVILMYRNRDDYLNNPSAAVYNQAFPCNGKIRYEVNMENISSGDYYLLAGEQGKTGTWVPVSDLRKINLDITEKEIEQ